jgi:hypothetical protein
MMIVACDQPLAGFGQREVGKHTRAMPRDVDEFLRTKWLGTTRRKMLRMRTAVRFWMTMADGVGIQTTEGEGTEGKKRWRVGNAV